MPFHCAPCRIRSRQKTVAEVECKPIENQPAAWRFVENLPSSALPSLSRTLIDVGPLVREGFVDIDTGIRDSIRDIRHEVRAAVFSDVNATAHAAVPLKA